MEIRDCHSNSKSKSNLEVTDLRNISGLLNCDRKAESLLAELIMSDMENVLDKSQFGNRKSRSINHYLIKMINRILTALDNNSKKEVFAVVANLIDWSKAFPRQCPQLGVESFIKWGKTDINSCTCKLFSKQENYS